MENTNLIQSKEERNWGDLPLIQSNTNYNVKFTDFKDLESLDDGTDVVVRARLQTKRGKGNCCFLVLRDTYMTLQAVAFKSDDTPKPCISYIQKVSSESIVDVYGKLKKLDQAVDSCSLKYLELNITKFYVISRSANQLPFQLEDANRNEKEEVDGQPIVALKTRLDNRVMDLRTPASQAIFRVQSKICQYYREYLTDQDFVEIHTPKIIGGTSEGGAEIFRLDYFGQSACLAQSPQLYKQMMIMGDFKRVFEIGHVFRAEKSFTNRHLCEFIGLDGEMEIKEHYSEVLHVIGEVFKYIFTNLKKNCEKEIEVIKQQYGYEDFLFLDETLVLTFEEGCKLLQEAGVEQDPFADLSTETERKLGELVRDKYKTDFYILHKYPETARPFYTMLDKEDPRYTCSYDVFMRGQEIISGSQRIHDSELLTERAKIRGIPVDTIKDYIESFTLGAYPHGGFGVGLERVTFLFLNLYDVKKASLFPRDPMRLNP